MNYVRVQIRMYIHLEPNVHKRKLTEGRYTIKIDLLDKTGKRKVTIVGSTRYTKFNHKPETHLDLV